MTILIVLRAVVPGVLAVVTVMVTVVIALSRDDNARAGEGQ
jgi:hypothetical protein